MTNAQVALEAASRVHQKVHSAGGNSPYPSVDMSSDHAVLSTAERFLKFLVDNANK